jgi:hypothetical protein
MKYRLVPKLSNTVLFSTTAAAILIGAVGYSYLNIEQQDATVTALSPSPSPENQTLAWWNGLIQQAELDKQLDIAADYTTRKAAYYKSIGNIEEASRNYALADSLLKQAAFIPDSKANSEPSVEAEPELALYRSVPASAPNRPYAKFEPKSGVYLGMLGADRRVGFDVQKIEDVYGRGHPMFLSYVGWRKYQTDTNSYFPFRTADRVKQLGGSLQIGWEPRYGLEDVKDDEYVRKFAQEAKQSGIPVFLRYASEMNGVWVPWYDEPKLYIEKFRLVHDIMKEEAPNVAMVWSPNFLPADNIDEYYPGDEYVDWVGFSLYATPLGDGQWDMSTNQIDYFKPLYAKYSHKPIMIAEGAVSHYHLKTDTSFAKWGEGQIGNMYGYLPRMFPQVKAITYFNFSKSRAVQSGMEHLYDIGENFRMDMLYKRLVQSPYFLDRIAAAPSAGSNPDTFAPVTSLPRTADAKHTLFTYVKLNRGQQPVAVAYSQNGKQLAISYELPWIVDLSASQIDPKYPLSVTVFNEKMEKIVQKEFPVDAK